MRELPNTPGAAPMLVDRRKAGWIMGVSAGTIDNLWKRGELASLKIGARRLYAVSDLLAFVEARKGTSRHE